MMRNINIWTTGSLGRNFIGNPPGANLTRNIVLARNDKASFQLCLRKQDDGIAHARLSLQCPDSLTVRARSVGHVPLRHHSSDTDTGELDGWERLPGYVPDPLFDAPEVILAPMETNSYWISVQTASDTPPGSYRCSLAVDVDSAPFLTFDVVIKVHPLELKKNVSFPVTHWFYADALCDWYDVEPFTADFWTIVKPYFENLVDHGTNVIHSPIFTPPTDGVKRPNQLLKIKTEPEGRYSFDWTDVKKWVSLAQNCGFEFYEWVHLFSQWGVEHAIPVYENYDGRYEGRLLWPIDTPADSALYRRFLSQFLPAFKQFLEEEAILGRSFFHVSDEPHGKEHLENYKKARSILSELAPWMKVMDALSEITFAGVTDMSVCVISSASEFIEAGIPRWDYFCCGPRGAYLNRLMDTPLAKLRGAGWLFYKLGACGFLHWGYNYWYKSQSTELIDPFAVGDALAWPNWSSGDPFVVYPGENGPLDSIRWEVFSESLKDYELLQALTSGNGDDILCCFKSYSDYPKDENWYTSARERLFARHG